MEKIKLFRSFAYNSRSKPNFFWRNFVDLIQAKGSKVHCLLEYAYLAVSYNSLKNLFSLEIFFFGIKITSFRITCTTRSPGPLNLISITCSINISRSLFVYVLSSKNRRGGGDLLFKVGIIHGFYCNHVIGLRL